MLRLAAIFGEHMVLQQGKPVAVFGEADGPVDVALAQHRVTAACKGGRFLARLPSLPAGGPHTLTVRCGQESVTLGDVMVGEVWLCGGQSNMEFRLRGFLFYQGEQDTTRERAPGYAALLTALIAQWRALFEDETLFFAAAQLPRFGAEPSVEDWPAIRAAQQQVIDSTDSAALACLLDCGERDNVHPTDKQTPGRRLAAAALAHVYGQDVPGDAPRLEEAALCGDRLTLRFAHTGGALRLPENAQAALHVEGAALEAVSADGETLALTLKDAQGAVRVRYAQENWFEPVLTGKSGLPVFPFDVTIRRE